MDLNAGLTQVLTTVCTPAPSCTPVNYSWDNNGNLLSDWTSTYTYDTANQLKTVAQGGNNYSFTYNGLGDRVSQTVNAATTTYALDLAAGLTQVLVNGNTRYFYGLGRIGEQQTAGWAYHLQDVLNSERQLTNSAGTVIQARSYQPFGSVLSSAGTANTSYGFTGEWTDATGLVHLRARYYAPGVGRFITRDVWEGDPNQPMSFNAWPYAYANPSNLTDPSGNVVCFYGRDTQTGLCNPDPVGSSLPPGLAAIFSSSRPAITPGQAILTATLVGCAYLVRLALQALPATQTLPRTWQEILNLPEQKPEIFIAPPQPRPQPTATPCDLPSGRYPFIPTVPTATLLGCRPEAARTIDLIMANGPFPFPRDDRDFYNDSGALPPPSNPARTDPTGYREYTVLTPGTGQSGARRIVTYGPVSRLPSQFTVMYYTDDHYLTFTEID